MTSDPSSAPSAFSTPGALRPCTSRHVQPLTGTQSSPSAPHPAARSRLNTQRALRPPPQQRTSFTGQRLSFVLTTKAPTPWCPCRAEQDSSPEPTSISPTPAEHARILDTHPAFAARLAELYPGAMPAEQFLSETKIELAKHGFTKQNSIPCISLCRDEMCSGMVELVQRFWCQNPKRYGAYNLSSVCGLPLAGRHGFLLAASHAPHFDGMERFVFVAMPHIAIDGEGKVGSCSRPGRLDSSVACSALVYAAEDLKRTGLKKRPELDMTDVEQSVLRMCLYDSIAGDPAYKGAVPPLETLTSIMLGLIEESIRQVIEGAVKGRRCNYACITGVMVHGPRDSTFVAPALIYCNQGGESWEIVFDQGGDHAHATQVKRDSHWLDGKPLTAAAKATLDNIERYTHRPFPARDD